MPASFNPYNFIQSNPASSQRSLSSHSSDLSFSPEPIEEIKLFLDMDGVLTDFTGACEKLGDDMMFWYSNDRELFWKKITSAGIEFWSEMSWMPGGRELHGFLRSSGYFPTILSALPGPERKKALINAREGKIKWIRKELGASYAEILKTSASGKRQEVLEFCIRIPAEQSGVSVRFLRLGKSSDTNFKINLYKPANASFLEAFGRFMLPAYRLQ